MSRLVYLLCLLFFTFSCAKDYVERPLDQSPKVDAITLSSTYSSVDFSEFNIQYNWDDILQLQVRRESFETPLTVYDGDLVVLDNTSSTSFKDYKSNDDLPTLLPDSKYYYSIFYTSGSIDSSPVRGQDFIIETLSYQEGMLQLFSELITYAKTKKDGLEFILSSELMRLFYQDIDTIPKLKNSDLMNHIGGVLVPALMFAKTNNLQTTSLTQNQTLLDLYSNSKVKLAIDYLSASNTVDLGTSRTNFVNKGLIGFNRPGSDTSLFTNLPPMFQKDDESDIEKLTDDTLKNFIFLDVPVTNMVTELNQTDYDLIVMTPFKSSPWTAITDVYSYAEVQSLKTKSNGVNKRLVFAYMDLGQIWEDSYYWNSDWTQVENRPNWIDRSISGSSKNHYVKYWRREWQALLKPVIDMIVNQGYDGIVFGGGEYFAKYPL